LVSIGESRAAACWLCGGQVNEKVASQTTEELR